MKKVIWNLLTAGIAILQLVVLSREFNPVPSLANVQPSENGKVLSVNSDGTAEWDSLGGGGGGGGTIYTYSATTP